MNLIIDFIEKMMAGKLLAHSYVMHIPFGSFYGGTKTENNREIGGRETISTQLCDAYSIWRLLWRH